MKISTKSRYGTRAVLEIGLNRNRGTLTRKQISKNQDIPSSYLENILITLKTKGLIRTIRGPGGGYKLVKKPEEITVLEIVRILEGYAESVPCIQDDTYCSRTGICAVREVWQELEKAQENVLGNITIGDLMRKTEKLFENSFSI